MGNNRKFPPGRKRKTTPEDLEQEREMVRFVKAETAKAKAEVNSKS